MLSIFAVLWVMFLPQVEYAFSYILNIIKKIRK